MVLEPNANEEVSFTLAGQAFTLSASTIRAAVSGHVADPVHTYWVSIEDREWPVKQVLSLATGLGAHDFQSSSAQRQLKNLGFTVEIRVDRNTKQASGPSARQAETALNLPSPRSWSDVISIDHSTWISAQAESIISQLEDKSLRMSVDEFLAADDESLNSPGIYAWWVDRAGAVELSAGLNETIDEGLLYAGLAGATRTGGTRAKNTLRGRIATMHLGAKHTFSTLRYSVGSILAATSGASAIDEVQVTKWMR